MKLSYKMSQNTIFSKKYQNNLTRYQSISYDSGSQPSIYRPKSLNSDILENYSKTLEYDVMQAQRKKQIHREKIKKRAIQNFIAQKHKNSAMLEELQSIKHAIKLQSSQMEYELIRKQKALQMKIASSISDHKMPSIQPIRSPYCSPTPYYGQHQINLRKTSFEKQDIPYANLALQNRKSFFSESRSDFLDNSQKQTNLRKTIKHKLVKPLVSKNMKNFQRHHNHQKSGKKLRRCFLAVYFLKCLQKHHLKVVKQRKKHFQQFWPAQFIKLEEIFKNYFYQKSFQLFKLLLQKSYYELLPSESDFLQLKDEKKRTIRNLIKIFFQCLKDLKGLNVLGKIAWALCSHQSFADNGVLVQSELDNISFEPEQRYLRMDKNSSKSQILSTILIKSLLFNRFLHPEKRWPKYFNPTENKTLVQNMRLLGSIIYQIFLAVQDEYIDLINQEAYPLANFQSLQPIKDDIKIQCAPSLLYETKTQDNEIISGLFSVDELKKHGISFKKMMAYSAEVKEVIDRIYEMSVRCDDQFKRKMGLKIQKNNLN